MDPFEVRMQFLNILKGLDASQPTIQKVVSYSLRYFSRCGDDLWECIVEKCQTGTLNMRINILYMLDNLCEASLTYQSQGLGPSSSAGSSSGSLNPRSYVQYVSRDLGKIVNSVVPETRGGLVNLMSTRQILDSWRTKRIVDPSVVDEILSSLQTRLNHLHLQSESNGDKNDRAELSRDEVQRRFEEDRERHKLLRQKRWHVPVPAHVSDPLATQPLLPKLSSALSLRPPPPPSNLPPTSVNSPSTPPPTTEGDSAEQTKDPSQSLPPSASGASLRSASAPEPSFTEPLSALDIEFDNAWETTSDWNEDDDDACKEENFLCFGPDTVDATPLPNDDELKLEVTPMEDVKSALPTERAGAYEDESGASASAPPIHAIRSYADSSTSHHNIAYSGSSTSTPTSLQPLPLMAMAPLSAGTPTSILSPRVRHPQDSSYPSPQVLAQNPGQMYSPHSVLPPPSIPLGSGPQSHQSHLHQPPHYPNGHPPQHYPPPPQSSNQYGSPMTQHHHMSQRAPLPPQSSHYSSPYPPSNQYHPSQMGGGAQPYGGGPPPGSLQQPQQQQQPMYDYRPGPGPGSEYQGRPPSSMPQSQPLGSGYGPPNGTGGWQQPPHGHGHLPQRPNPNGGYHGMMNGR